MLAGVTEWRVKNPVHLVCYYRYFRFFPDGTFVYRTSPEVPVKVERSMRTPFLRSRGDEGVLRGRYVLRVSRVLHSVNKGKPTTELALILCLLGLQLAIVVVLW